MKALTEIIISVIFWWGVWYGGKGVVAYTIAIWRWCRGKASDDQIR
jgi:hypothetical protein